MYFDNNTGDASLDWMRTGLTDMMVTDLSQSTDIEVLGTDRLVQILQDLRRADDRVISADVVREIASRAAVDTVLVGSYVRAGGTIRISAKASGSPDGSNRQRRTRRGRRGIEPVRACRRAHQPVQVEDGGVGRAQARDIAAASR